MFQEHKTGRKRYKLNTPGLTSVSRLRRLVDGISAVSSSPLSRAKVSRSNFIFDGERNRVLQNDAFCRENEI
jgi:hypothetical protein